MKGAYMSSRGSTLGLVVSSAVAVAAGLVSALPASAAGERGNAATDREVEAIVVSGE